MKNKIFSKLYKKLHIYGGLFSVFYMLIVGVSALNFQHHFFSEAPTDTITSVHQINFDSSLKKDSLARFIASELQINGHIPPWEFRNDSLGNLQFKINRPARTYAVSLNRYRDSVKVEEIHYGFGRILRALHFGSIDSLNDPMLKTWAKVAQWSAIFAFVTICTSFFFWYKKSIKTSRQRIILVFSGISSILFILYIWLVG